MLAVLLGGLAVCHAGDAETKSAERADQLAALIHNDMFYGADDYFGEHRDLAYADRVEPTDSGTTAGAESDEQTQVSGNSSASGGTSQGGGGGGDGGDDTSAENPGSPSDADDDTADDISEEVNDDVGDNVGDDNAGGG
ncbi:MAG: hypothetical protein HN341_12250 [Verrucomicrobia bacterium]|jgi:hypothetical protein|nr:hypothetical protein [Verrucomicrobiota bacterium]